MEPNGQDPSEGQGAKVVSGIGGWLILPVLGLIWTLITAVVWVFADYLPLMTDGIWPAVPTSGRALITFEVLVNLVLIVGPVVLLVLLFKKRRMLPKLMVGFFAFVLAVVVADSIGILLIGPELIPDAAVRAEAGWSISEVAQDILRALLASAIWIPYFLMSARVKNTFVLPSAAGDIQTTSTGPSPGLPVVVGTVTPTSGSAMTARPPASKAKRIVGVSVGIALVVSALLVWQCAAPSGAVKYSSGSTTGDTGGSAGTRTYTDPDYGYSIAYPSDWVMREDESVDSNSMDSPASEVSAFDPNGARSGLTYYDLFDVTVFRLGLPIRESELAAMREGIEAYLREQLPADVTIVVPLAEVRVADASGFSVTTTEVLEGTPLKSTIYWLYKADLSYVIFVQSAAENWDKKEPTFASIIASFRP